MEFATVIWMLRGMSAAQLGEHSDSLFTSYQLTISSR